MVVLGGEGGVMSKVPLYTDKEPNNNESLKWKKLLLNSPTLHPQPSFHNPKPCTLNPATQTLNPKPEP